MTSDDEVVNRGWEAVARGDWDALLADYVEDITFVMPGQNDVLEGKIAFRKMLDNLGAILSPRATASHPRFTTSASLVMASLLPIR